jgi:hypothetical protein
MTEKEAVKKIKGNPNLIEKFKKIFFSLEEPVISFTDLKLSDGTMISIDKPSAEIGAKVTVEVDGVKSDALDGDYTLEDGTVISVLGGMISEIATPAAEAGEGEIPMQSALFEDAVKTLTSRIEALELKVSAHNVELSAKQKLIEGQKVELSKHKELQKTTLEMLEEFYSSPASKPLEIKASIDSSNESRLEQMARAIKELKK